MSLTIIKWDAHQWMDFRTRQPAPPQEVPEYQAHLAYGVLFRDPGADVQLDCADAAAAAACKAACRALMTQEMLGRITFSWWQEPRDRSGSV